MIDLFASGFVFKIDGEGRKTKKTKLGQGLTVIILVLSMVYFCFLFYEFVERVVPPTIIDETLIQNSAFEYDFTYSPMHLKINVADESIDLNQYFTLWTIIETYDEVKPYIMNKCSQLYPNESKYDSDEYCVDQELAQLIINRNDSTDYQYMKVLVNSCDEGLGIDGQVLPNGDPQVFTCKTPQEIQDLIHEPRTYIELTTIFFELDHNNGILEEKDDIQKIFLDHNLLLHHHVIIKVAESDVDTHPFWTTHDTYFYAYDYRASSYFYSEDFAENKFSDRVMHDALYINEMVLDSNLLRHTIQYEKFAEMMAKFFSLFNTVVLIGVIGSLTSEAKILECTMDTYLREYYKSTAQDLHKQREIKELEKQKAKMQQNGQKIEPQEDEITQDLQNEKLPDIPNEEEILDINNFKSLYLNNTAKIILKKQKDKKKKARDETKLNKFLSRSNTSNIGINEDIDELQDEKEPENIDAEKLYLRMYKETQTATEFRQLYQEILNLKTQMQILLSEEQYATSFYLGRRLCFSKDLSSKNHIERQDQVQLSERYRRQLIYNFINNYEKNEYKDETSKRLYECLLEDVKELKRSSEQQHQSTFLNKVSTNKNLNQVKKITDKQTELQSSDVLEQQNLKKAESDYVEQNQVDKNFEKINIESGNTVEAKEEDSTKRHLNNENNNNN